MCGVQGAAPGFTASSFSPAEAPLPSRLLLSLPGAAQLPGTLAPQRVLMCLSDSHLTSKPGAGGTPVRVGKGRDELTILEHVRVD